MNTLGNRAAIFKGRGAGIARAAMVTVASLVLCFALPTGCGDGGPADDQSAAAFNALLTHKAGSGTFQMRDSGTHRLTLHNVAAATYYYTEQPEQAGETSTKAVFDQFPGDAVNLPRAAVIVTDPAVPNNQNVMIVRLMSASYDEARATLTFDMQIENNYQGKYLAHYVADADTSLPSTFGPVNVEVESLFHGCSKGYITCYRHYGCCSQSAVTDPVGRIKVDRCWWWSTMKCEPCSDDPCAKPFPNECGRGNCYDSCLNDDSCWP